MTVNKDKKTGTWYYHFKITVDGNTQWHKKRGFLTKHECLLAEEEFKLSLQDPIQYATFDQIIKSYLANWSNQVKSISVDTDRYIIIKLQNKFRNTQDFRDYRKIQIYINELDGKYSKTYVKKIYYTLVKICKFAVLYGYMSTNPMDRVRFSARRDEKKKEMKFWEPDQFKLFINEIHDPMMHLLYSTLYYMGCRKGEAMALTWKDIDFYRHTITINKTCKMRAREPGNYTTPPKTKNSYRTITMPKILYKEMKEWKDIVMGFSEYSDDFFVFGGCQPLPAETVRRHFKKGIYDANIKLIPQEQIPEIRIHDLRHSHASYLINHMTNGFTDFDIAKRLGDTVDTLHNTYAHWFKSADKGIVDFMDNDIQ